MWKELAIFSSSVLLATALAVETSRMSEPSDGSFRLEPPHFAPLFDGKLSEFMKAFANSEAGQLLASVTAKLHAIPSNHVARKSSSYLGQYPEAHKAQYQVVQPALAPLEGFSTASPQMGQPVLTAYVSLLLLLGIIPFTFIGIFGEGENYVVPTFAAIIGYTAGSLSMAILFGVIPDWLLVIVSLGCGGGAAYASYSTTKFKCLVVCVTLISCLLAGAILYASYAGLPFDQINPSYTGFAGLIFNTGFAGIHYWVLRLMYLAFVALFAVAVYFFLPSYVTGTPQDTDQEQTAKHITRYLVSYSCAWPVAGALTQIAYFCGAALTPLDPLSFFYVPCQIRYDSWETYFGLIAWGLIAHLFVYLRDKADKDSSFSPAFVTKTVKEQWRRITSSE